MPTTTIIDLAVPASLAPALQLSNELGIPVSLVIAAGVAVFLFVRYAIIAGGALALITVYAPKIQSLRVQKLPFTGRQFRREFGYSVLSVLVFGALTFAISSMHGNLFAFAMPVSAADWAWTIVSVPVALLMHDFYFYWMHRSVHTPGVYEWVHKVHHLSTNPSPLASFAFHPLEALFEALGFLLVVMLLPMTLPAFVAFSFLAFVLNVMGHLGYEFIPQRVLGSRVMRWLNSSTSHNVHHRKFRVNYGLYTLIWDRLFDTIDPKFELEISRQRG